MKNPEQKKDAFDKAVKKVNRIFDIFVNKDKSAPYPSHPFRAGTTAYGTNVVATCGDAYVIASFNFWTEDLLRQTYPHRHRRPEYNGSPYLGKGSTEPKTINVKELAERLQDIGRCRPENPYVSFRNVANACGESIPCAATAAQVAKLVACAKAAGKETVEMFSCVVHDHLSLPHVETSFHVGPYVVGLMMPLLPS